MSPSATHLLFGGQFGNLTWIMLAKNGHHSDWYEGNYTTSNN